LERLEAQPLEQPLVVAHRTAPLVVVVGEILGAAEAPRASPQAVRPCLRPSGSGGQPVPLSLCSSLCSSASGDGDGAGAGDGDGDAPGRCHADHGGASAGGRGPPMPYWNGEGSGPEAPLTCGLAGAGGVAWGGSLAGGCDSFAA